MKRYINIGIILSLGLLIIAPYTFAQQTQDEVLIVGKWQSESDSNSIIVFSSNGIATRYYDNEIGSSSNYYLSNTPPDCGEGTIQNDPKVDTYLKMVNTKNPDDIYCYYVDGLSKDVLNIMYVENGRIFIYNRISLPVENTGLPMK